jgi:hypothetical protein
VDYLTKCIFLNNILVIAIHKLAYRNGKGKKEGHREGGCAGTDEVNKIADRRAINVLQSLGHA